MRRTSLDLIITMLLPAFVMPGAAMAPTAAAEGVSLPVHRLVPA